MRMPVDPIRIGTKVRPLRETAGLSQSAVAKSIGISITAYAKIERDESEPSWGVVIALAQLFQVDCRIFAPGPDSEPAPEPPIRKPGRPRKEPPETD